MEGIRVLNVSHSLPQNKKVPVICLQGQWLENMGFEIGKRVVVMEERGRIALELAGGEYEKKFPTLKIGGVMFKKRRVPSIYLRGLWLKCHGFEIGRRVEISGDAGRLSVRLADG